MTKKTVLGRPSPRPVRALIILLFGMALGIVADRTYLAGIIPGAMVPTAAIGDFKLMAQAWNLIDAHYVDRPAIKPQRMTYAAISGMVDSLGDTGHSTFLTPREVRMANAAISGHFAGIGAEVRLKGAHVIIVTPIDGTPAQRAHLKPGDLILKVDGKSVVGESLSAVVERIRGPAGSKVTLLLQAPTSSDKRSVTLVRADIPVHSVSWHMLPGTRVADIRIASFSDGTAAGLDKALGEARRAGAKGVVLDLRNDPGGLLDQAIDVTSLLVRKGNVLLEKNVAGQIKPIPVRTDVPKFDLPLAVLINGGTASAAEIVAGALKDNVGAPLIGERSFGTGTVLRQFTLSNGSALLIAVREWLTPDGHTIWHKGIAPTQKVALSEKAIMLRPDAMHGLSASKLRHSDDAQLLAALKAVEARIAKHKGS
ncbi:MAG: S41 family peptidase [Acidihalobacter sp.]|uniref:S41 family peptidase n=1 Tax=Acidihalobacter sp. TaxID=1872108 RepID=UPI00307DE7AC